VISVFYDGKCGLCAREIAYFKKRRPKTSIAWHDIARHPESLGARDVSQSEALMFMRVESADGRLHSGVDAFIVMWGQFRGWALIARLLALPGIKTLAAKAYRLFARRRFSRHTHCRLAAERDGTSAERLI
jgi:predicted DCC family thiol-disulfide oxidoreductase YuxK